MPLGVVREEFIGDYSVPGIISLSIKDSYSAPGTEIPSTGFTQNLSCLRSSVYYPRFIGNDTAEELLTPFLRQLKFWCKNGTSLTSMIQL